METMVSVFSAGLCRSRNCSLSAAAPQLQSSCRSEAIWRLIAGGATPAATAASELNFQFAESRFQMKSADSGRAKRLVRLRSCCCVCVAFMLPVLVLPQVAHAAAVRMRPGLHDPLPVVQPRPLGRSDVPHRHVHKLRTGKNH